MIATRRNPNKNDDMDIDEIINAAMEDDNNTVADLLALGVDVNTSFQGFTVLHIACMHGNRSLVKILLDHSQHTQAIDFTLRTTERGLLAWQLALENHHFDLGELVIKTGNHSVQQRPRFVPN